MKRPSKLGFDVYRVLQNAKANHEWKPKGWWQRATEKGGGLVCS